jgi:hypothetical protein
LLPAAPSTTPATINELTGKQNEPVYLAVVVKGGGRGHSNHYDVRLPETDETVQTAEANSAKRRTKGRS